MDEARKALLANVIETYLTLNEEEQAAFQQLVASSEGEEIRAMISVYEQRGIEKGIEKGIEQGIEKGIEQGIVRGKRETLLRQMRQKFGDLPDSIRTRVEALSDSSELDRLSDRILTARTLEEMGLPSD